MKNEVEDYPEDFDGIFRFTNATDEDFVTLWNNKEYTYPAMKTVPMVIANSTLEEIQQIRKYFAKRLAEREFLKSKGFQKIKNGVKSDSTVGGTLVASCYNEEQLQPWIDDCLKPLEIAHAIVKPVAPQSLHTAAKAIGSGSKDSDFPAVDLNETFKDSNAELLSKQH